MYEGESFERPRLPATYRPRPELRRQSHIALVFCVLLIGVIVLAGTADREPASLGFWVCAAVLWLAFLAFVLHRLNVAHGVLTVTDSEIEFRTLRGAQRIRWADVDGMAFHSTDKGQRRGVGAVAGLALGPVGDAVAGALMAGGNAANPFAGPSSSRDGRVPFGRIDGNGGKTSIRLSEAFDWNLYDDLGPEAHARGIPIRADGTDVPPSPPR